MELFFQIWQVFLGGTGTLKQNHEVQKTLKNDD